MLNVADAHRPTTVTPTASRSPCTTGSSRARRMSRPGAAGRRSRWWPSTLKDGAACTSRSPAATPLWARGAPATHPRRRLRGSRRRTRLRPRELLAAARAAGRAAPGRTAPQGLHRRRRWLDVLYRHGRRAGRRGRRGSHRRRPQVEVDVVLPDAGASPRPSSMVDQLTSLERARVRLGEVVPDRRRAVRERRRLVATSPSGRRSTRTPRRDRALRRAARRAPDGSRGPWLDRPGGGAE